MLSAVGSSMVALFWALTHPQGDPTPERLRQIAGPDAARFYVDHVQTLIGQAFNAYWGSIQGYGNWVDGILHAVIR